MDKKEEYEKQKEKIFVNAKKVIEISKKYTYLNLTKQSKMWFKKEKYKKQRKIRK